MAKKVKKSSSSKNKAAKKKAALSQSARSVKKAKKSTASLRKTAAKKAVTKKKSVAKVKQKASKKKLVTTVKRRSTTKKAAKKTSKRTSSTTTKKKTKKVTSNKRKSSAKLARTTSSSSKKKVSAKKKMVSPSSKAKKKPLRPKLAIRVGMDIPKKTPASQRQTNHHTDAGASMEDPIQFTEQRKTPKTPLRAKALREFKKLLLHKRDELTGDVNHMAGSSARAAGSGGAEHSSAPVHMADLGTDNWEHEFTLGLIVNEQKRIRDIDEALKRIVNKTYGVCLATHKPISVARLQAKPWAKYCIDHAKARDEGRA